MAKQSSTDRIEKKIELKAPIARVWRALSDHREFGQWFRVKLEGPFVVGQRVKGNITYPGYEHLVLEADVVALEPNRRMAFRWHPHAVDKNEDYSKDPQTLVEFVLEETPRGTLLTLTESGFDAIPAARRGEAFRMNDGGWTEQMKHIEAHVSASP